MTRQRSVAGRHGIAHVQNATLDAIDVAPPQLKGRAKNTIRLAIERVEELLLPVLLQSQELSCLLDRPGPARGRREMQPQARQVVAHEDCVGQVLGFDRHGIDLVREIPV